MKTWLTPLGMSLLGTIIFDGILLIRGRFGRKASPLDFFLMLLWPLPLLAVGQGVVAYIITKDHKVRSAVITALATLFLLWSSLVLIDHGY